MNTDNEQLNVARQQIEELLNRDRVQNARSVLANALPQYPDDEDLLYFSAYIDWREDKLDEALEGVERLLNLSPKSYAGRTLLADIHEEQNRFREAESVYMDLFSDYPESAILHARYALLMLKTMHVDKASRLAAESLRLEPENPLGLRASVMASLITGDTSTRDERLSELIRQQPEARSTVLALVQVLLDKGDYKAAIRIGQELLAAYPHDETVVDMVVELKTQSHWSMKPLWPLQRWGWGASIGLWFAAVILVRTVSNESLKSLLIVIILGFVIYSWLWPFLLRRLMRR